MKNCLWSWSLVGLFVVQSAFGADPVVILRDDGTYLLQPNSMTLVKVTVVDQRGLPGPNPNPPPTPPPDGSTVEQTAERLARQVNNTSEAAVLGVIYAFFSREVAEKRITPENAAKVIRTARNVALSGTKGEERWKTWGNEIDKLMGAAPQAVFFVDVKVGLAKAAGVDPGVFDQVGRMTVVDAIAAQSDGTLPAGFDWTLIIQIITAIISLLRDLGIFK